MESYTPVTLRPAKSSLPVLLSGLLTTALSLIGVYLLNTYTDMHLMGLYADYVIPAGAMIVGAAAASGYGVASWISGVKITKSLLWMVLGLQLLAYWSAQYIHFNSLHLHYKDGTPVGFFTYFDFVARSFAWKHDNDKFGEPLGMWGYLFRCLEVIGFCGGGIIVPVLLRKAPYCEACQIYMRGKSLGLIPASVPNQKIKKADTAGQAAYRVAQEQAFAAGQTKLADLLQLANDGKTPQLNRELQPLAAERKPTAKLAQRIEVKLISCRHCWNGHLAATLMVGHGKQQKSSVLSTTPVRRDFVQSIWQRV
jgi:hypothetical protein